MIEEFAQDLSYLVLGAGRAGQRHIKTLMNEFGVKQGNFVLYDPVKYPIAIVPIETHKDVLDLDIYDVVIIASPPDTHADYIKRYKDKWILCEKPLTGRNEQYAPPDVDKLMIAYNYLFNPDVLSAITQYKRQKQYEGQTTILSSHNRESLPSWGIVYDHLPHSMALLTYLWGDNGRIAINDAAFYRDEYIEKVSVSLRSDPNPTVRSNVAEITEIVNFTTDVPRLSTALLPNGQSIDMTPNPQMFTSMWENFFRAMIHDRPPYPGIEFGRAAQMNIDRVDEYLKEVFGEDYYKKDGVSSPTGEPQ